MKRRLLAGLLAVSMTLTLHTGVVMADSGEIVDLAEEDGATSDDPVDGDDYEELVLDEYKTIYVEGQTYTWLTYTPDEDGDYVFTSFADEDTYGVVSDVPTLAEDDSPLYHDDDGGEDCNFSVSCTLTAGETYYFGARYYSDSNEGEFDVQLTKKELPFLTYESYTTVDYEGYVDLHVEATVEAASQDPEEEEVFYAWYFSADPEENGWEALSGDDDSGNSSTWRVKPKQQGLLPSHSYFYKCRVGCGDHLEEAFIEVWVNSAIQGELTYSPELDYDEEYDCPVITLNDPDTYPTLTWEGTGADDSELTYAWFWSSEQGDVQVEDCTELTGETSNALTLTRDLLQPGFNSFSCRVTDTYGSMTYWVTFLAVCGHNNTTQVAATEATCTEYGYTEGTQCQDCGEWVDGHERLPKAEHQDENGDEKCDVCGRNPNCDIVVGEQMTISVSEGEIVRLKFIPEESGTYSFTAFSDEDTCGYLYDADGDRIAMDDESGSGSNFLLTYQLTAGETYYFGAGYYDSTEGEFDVLLTRETFSAWADSRDYFEIIPGESVTMSVGAEAEEGEELTYQWYRYDEDEWEWLELEGATAASYQADADTEGWVPGGYYSYKCVVSCGNASKTVSFEVLVTSTLEDYSTYVRTVLSGQTVTFQAEVTTTTENEITYQWYRRVYNEDDEEWEDTRIDGADTAELELEVTAEQAEALADGFWICRCSDGVSEKDVWFSIRIGTFVLEEVDTHPQIDINGDRQLSVAVKDAQGDVTYSWYCLDEEADDGMDGVRYQTGSDSTWQIPQACVAQGHHCFDCVVTCEGKSQEVWFTVEYVDNMETTHTHSWDEGTVTKEATCKEEGIRTYHCTVENCDETKTEIIAKAAHTPESIAAVEASCTETGLTEGSKCSVCGEILKEQEIVEKKDHTPADAAEENRVEPTWKKAGSFDSVIRCSVCGTEISSTTETIPAKGQKDLQECSLALEKTEYVYSGKARTPAVVLKDGSETISSDYYTVAYENNTAAGTAKVTVTAKDEDIPYTGSVSAEFTITKAATTLKLSAKTAAYTGKAISIGKATKAGSTATIKYTYYTNKSCTTKTTKSKNGASAAGGAPKYVGLYYVKATVAADENYKAASKIASLTINPKATALKSLAAASKAFTAKWSKQTAQVDGYQIRYSTSSKFSSYKTVTISKNTTVSKKISSLKGNKKYYVQIRTYKKVGTKPYYSDWSGTKSVTTKS